METYLFSDIFDRQSKRWLSEARGPVTCDICSLRVVSLESKAVRYPSVADATQASNELMRLCRLQGFVRNYAMPMAQNAVASDRMG